MGEGTFLSPGGAISSRPFFTKLVEQEVYRGDCRPPYPPGRRLEIAASVVKNRRSRSCPTET